MLENQQWISESNDTILPSSGLTLTFSCIISAPSVAPQLNVMEISHSYVKLHWDEIPLEQRNGIIQGYTVYFWNETNNIEGIQRFKLITDFWMEDFYFIIIIAIINRNVSILSQVIKTEETSIVVRDLQPLTKYEALLTVHTMGGSLNGSVVALATGHIGEYLFLYDHTVQIYIYIYIYIDR